MTWNTFGTAGVSINANEWDANYNIAVQISTMPCTVAGTNTLVVTPSVPGAGNTPPVSAYASYQIFSAIATATNTGATTANVGALGALNVYKDTPAGPVVLVGGEIVIGNLIELTYDSALNTGSGGFHLKSSSQTVIGGLAHIVSSLSSITFLATNPNTTSNQTVTLTGAKVTDNVMIGSTVVSTGVSYDGFVQAANTVVVRALNITGSTITPPSAVYRVTAMGFV